MPHTEMDRPTDTPHATRWIGRVIDDRYKIVELLGEGGMGAVFVAEHMRLHKLVAFKTIRTEFAAHSQAEARFTREALATARLDHPHVASAIDYGPLPEGGAYLVTQLVRGESLSKRLESGPLPWLQVAQLGSQIADALAAAHVIGIVHRDLKPDNILLEQRRDGVLHARVVDFGIARVSGEQGGTIADVAQPITRAGAVIGTPGYMAPEQAVGGQIDFRVDLYALGVVLWECVTGQMLWQGDSLTELYARQLSRPAPSLRGDVPDALAGIIDRLLARTPTDRPSSAQEVRDELRRLALSNEFSGAPTPAATGSARSSVAPTPGEVTVADIKPANEAATALSEISESAPRRTPRAVWVVAALVLVLVAVWLASGTDPAPPTSTATSTPSERAPASASKPAERRERATLDQLIAEAPAKYADDVKMLLGSRNAEARRLAGETLANAPRRAGLPEYLRQLAQLELGRCSDKRQILGEIESAGEARALLALEALADMPSSDCPELGADLARVIARLDAQ